MRFFNLDLHIAVIADIKQILESMGHEVTNWSLSSHAWVMGREIDKVDIVNHQTWRGINRDMCDAFYERYRYDLDGYDAFIVTHTPCFAMLYERWNKPIICVASTRYEAPFSDNRSAWEDFNNFLRKNIDNGLIIAIANNKYDAAYAEYFTERPWRVIPSLCDYTNAFYTGTRSQSLYVSKFRHPSRIDGLVNKEGYFKPGMLSRVTVKLGLQARSRGYSWQDLAAFRSAVLVPYNASIMSIFEMYASGIPMLFPSLQFATELYRHFRHAGVFSELSYNQVRGLPSRSVIPSDSRDPNNYENVQNMAEWIAKADFYDPENLKHLVYFDSFEELSCLLGTIDVRKIHDNMVGHHQVRSARAHRAWEEVLNSMSMRLGLRTQ